MVATRGYQHARVEQAAAALEQIAGRLQLVRTTSHVSPTRDGLRVSGIVSLTALVKTHSGARPR